MQHKSHSAAFPLELPSWFIRLFTKENDTVMDPFMGSGTTLFAAEKLKRNAIGIDILEEYCQTVKNEMEGKELYLFEEEKEYVIAIS